ncbi:MAG: YgiQ family radical SAM protein [Chitinispirillaceae bacterium]|nr:YgiQ family radical SAM protein [Chitinispirillaceae bacterium]
MINTSKNLFLPTSSKEMLERGWGRADIILITGDAYIDHPAFGVAIIARVLEKEGYKVAVIPQPNWRDDLRDFKKLGAPTLFFGVTSGNMDSMVNHYTANKRLRSDDAFTPGNKAGFRPDYAVEVYCNILKQLYPKIPIIIGGIEASLRRLTHYDYWSDSLKPSILVSSKADMLVYGMGEKAIVEIAYNLAKGKQINSLKEIPQTAYLSDYLPEDTIELNSYEECLRNKRAFAENFVILEEEANKIDQRRLAEGVDNKWVVVNPSYHPLTEEEIDTIYDLPYTRLPHPRYWKKEPILAFEMIKDSITIHRGCFGGCSFCTISAHQGKFISSRSKESILKEIKRLISMPTFKGHITDLGGPTANTYKMKGKNTNLCKKCKRPSCIFPSICKNLNIDFSPLIELYREVRKISSVKKVTIGSGIRYDLIIDKDGKLVGKNALEYLEELIRFHVSGRLKVAPEHTSEEVLKLVRKPSFKNFVKFYSFFNSICKKYNISQQLVPYFISSLPGCKIEDMAELSLHTKRLKLKLEQVQDFTPTPMSLASVMYYTGLNPYTMENIYISRSIEEKKLQQLFFFLYNKEKRNELRKELLRKNKIEVIRRIGL